MNCQYPQSHSIITYAYILRICQKSVRNNDVTTPVHPLVCDGLIFGINLTGFMMQPNEHVSSTSFLACPLNKKCELSQLFSYILLGKSTVILTRTLFLVEPLKVVRVGLSVLTLTAG